MRLSVWIPQGVSPRAALPLAAGAIYKTVLASTALTGGFWAWESCVGWALLAGQQSSTFDARCRLMHSLPNVAVMSRAWLWDSAVLPHS